MTQPRWFSESEDRSGELVESFQKNLRRVAVQLARHERADSIDRRHVDNAYEALVACGIDRVPWYKRPQLKTTLAEVLIAAALAVPEFITLAIDDVRVAKAASSIVILLLAGLALWMYVWS